MATDKRGGRILKKLFNLEVMAVQIYRCQIGALADPEEKAMMVAAMENEQHHRETFRSLLAGRGMGPSPRWPFYWLVGQTLGRTTSLLGRSAVFRGDIAFENKAAHEYASFLERDWFTEEEREFIIEFMHDEERHSANWRKLLESSA